MFERTQRVIQSDHESRVSPAEIEPLLRSLIATLTDIDFEYEQERQKVDRSAADPEFKARMSCRLERQHHERRRPYVEELTRLNAACEQTPFLKAIK